MSVKIKVTADAVGKILSEWLIASGYAVSAHCGGRGVCGKCKVKVISGAFGDKNSPGKLLVPDKDGCILSCQALCLEGSEITEIVLPDTGGSGLTHFEEQAFGAEGEGFGIAVDVGTTTVAAALVNRRTGEIVKTLSALNPQRSFGADVISRISAAANGNLEKLTSLIIGQVNDMTVEFEKMFPDIEISEAVISGNTTMLHLFCGVSPESMGVYPFTPAFTAMKELSGAELGLKIKKAVILPGASAFIGSDITAGIMYCKMQELPKPSLLVDIGTNGEMVICNGKNYGCRLYCASAAAGPALEGANISCGVGGINGAVCKVTNEEGIIKYRTIGDKPVCGLCGSGLIDTIAVMLEKEAVDETGYLEDEEFILTGEHVYGDGKAESRIEDGKITVTQQDVREFQLAKSAISAGIEALLDYAGLKASDIENIFIAGGLGYYMDIANARKTGIIPLSLTGNIKAVGNTSLAGAIGCLCSEKLKKETEKTAEKCETFELNQSEVFNKGFIENMIFPMWD